MVANTEPIFSLTPVVGMVEIDTANTNLDGTGTIGTVLTGSTDGTRVTKIRIQATVTTTAGMVRLYIDDGAIYLWKEVVVDAITIDADTEAFSYILELFGERALVLPSGYILKASTNIGENFNVIAEGGNY